jgi:hypothetical protein
MGDVAAGQAKTQVTLTGQWQPVTVRYTPADPSASTLDFNAYELNAAPGTCFYADDASVVPGVTGPAAGPDNGLTVADGAADDGLGTSVAVSNGVMVVGAPYAAVNGHAGQGAAYVFTRSNGTWTQQAKLTAADGAANDHFGYSVAISGTTIAIGAPTASVNGHAKQGAAYVFAGTGGLWAQQAKLAGADGGANYQIGYAVAVSGDTVIAGAPGCPTDLTPEWTTVSSQPGGRAYAFSDSTGAWAQQAELTIPAGCVRAVAVSGSTAVLGVPGYGADVFTQSGGAWTLQATLKPANLTGYYPVGRSVAVSGGTIVIGGPANPGAAYVFTGAGATWTEQATLTASDGGATNLLGTSVAIADGTIVVGAPAATVAGQANQGAAYVFTGAGPAWTLHAKLTAASGDAGAQLGTSVALSGTTVVAGAPYAHSLQGAAYPSDGP